MNKNLDELLIENQYKLPTKLYYYAERYPHVSFIQALCLYELTVKEIIILFNAKHLYDGPLSFGKGTFLARKKWLEKMEEAEKIYCS